MGNIYSYSVMAAQEPLDLLVFVRIEVGVHMKMQNTHWYKAGPSRDDGWTADPCQAPPSEVDRVGTHDCDVLACTERHSGTRADYVAERKA